MNANDFNPRTFSLGNKIAEFSAKNYLRKAKKEEWKTVIVLIMAARIFTILVGIYAGYAFMRLTMSPMISNTTILAIASFTTLLLLELLNMLFLTKAFKFMFHGEWKIFAITAAVSALLYSASFYVSTNGLAMHQAKGVDRTTEIMDNYTMQKVATEKDYEEQIDAIDALILAERSNPQGWSNGVKDGKLTKEQLKKISNWTAEKNNLKVEKRKAIATLKDAQGNELNSNQSIMTETSERYYSIVGAIMVSQVLLSLLIVYLFSIVTKEEKPEEVSKNKITTVLNDQQSMLESKMNDMLMRQFMQYNHAINMMQIGNASALSIPQNTGDDKSKSKEGETKTRTIVKPLGQKKTSEIDGNAGNGVDVQSTNGQNPNTDQHTRILEKLRKHRPVVLSIVKHVPEDNPTISNAVIFQHVKPETNRSRTIIREIYTAVKAMGYENALKSIQS